MEHYIEKLRSYLTEQKLPDESPQSILNMLYEAYNEINLMDNDKVKQDFHELYELMNGKPLREMDQIVYPVCTLCYYSRRYSKDIISRKRPFGRT